MDGIGERLKRRREELGLSLDDAAETMKFRPDMLEAVEEGRAGVFSAEVYRNSFIRAYARVLGLDGDQLVKDQKSEEERAQEALRDIRVGPPKSARLNKTLIGIAAGVVLTIVVLVVVDRAGQRKDGSDQAAGAQENASSEAPAVREGAKGAPRMNWVPGKDESGQSPEGTEVRSDGPSPTEPGRPEQQAGTADGLTTAPGPAVSPPAAAAHTLVIEARRGARLTVASGGDTLFYGNMTGGDRQVLSSDKSFVILFLSDRRAVELNLDGKPVSLPSSGGKDVYDYPLP
ncbi:MAG: RodZ domain-containing protein [Candidatus Eisenbacteria bacterium]